MRKKQLNSQTRNPKLCSLGLYNSSKLSCVCNISAQNFTHFTNRLWLRNEIFHYFPFFPYGFMCHLFACRTYVLCICTFLYPQLLCLAIFMQFLWHFISLFTSFLSHSFGFYSFLLVRNQISVISYANIAPTQFVVSPVFAFYSYKWVCVCGKHCCNFLIPFCAAYLF